MSGQSGTFVISLDCEGKWGFTGPPKPYLRLFTDERLTQAYRDLVDTFGAYDVPATFAFVMAFTLTPAERPMFIDRLVGSGPAEPWLEPYRNAIAAGELQGWHVPSALDVVRSASRHEIGCHGFSHRPLGAHLVSRAAVDSELSAAQEVARLKGLDLRSFVFPRNQVGHVEALRDHGFAGYRTRLERPAAMSKRGAAGRALSVLEQFDVLARAQRPRPPENGLVPVPAGHMFNWRAGARRAVPSWVTVLRWKNQLNDAVRNGGVVHLWLHPHNLITGPGTREMLDQVIGYAASLRDSGKLRIVTMGEYCTEQAAASPAPRLSATCVPREKMTIDSRA